MFLANENFPRPGIVLLRESNFVVKSIQEEFPGIRGRVTKAAYFVVTSMRYYRLSSHRIFPKYFRVIFDHSLLKIFMKQTSICKIKLHKL